MKRILFSIISVFIMVSFLSAEEEKKDVNKDTKDYISDLSSKDEDTVVKAIDWLGKEEEGSAVPKLINLIKNDQRMKVRLYAVIALGLIKDEKTVKDLEQTLLNDQSPEVRYSSILAITKIGSDDWKRTMDVFEKVKKSESDPYIKDYLTKMEAYYKEKM